MPKPEATPSLLDYCADFPDPRIDRCKEYPLLDRAACQERFVGWCNGDGGSRGKIVTNVSKPLRRQHMERDCAAHS